MAASSEHSPPPFPDSEEAELLEDSDDGADAFTGTVSLNAFITQCYYITLKGGGQNTFT